MTNRTRTYECMCLLDNREVRKGWEPLKEAVASLFTKHGAKVLSNRRWDERRLAYPIKGQQRATYLLIYFEAETQAIPALRRDLEFSESLLRNMIVECENVPADAYEPEAEFDVNAIPEDDAPDAPEEPADDAKEAEGADGESAEAGEGAGDGGEPAGEGEKGEGEQAAGDAAAPVATDGGEENK